MRLGEIKQKIDSIVNENKQIVLEVENQFSGQAFAIEYYSMTMDVLYIIFNQDWSDFVPDQIKAQFEGVYKNTNEDIRENILPSTRYNELNEYISQINSRLPIYYSILETMVEDQEELTINIKLSNENIQSITSLNKLNEDLESIFKKIVKHHGFGGDVEFRGFDIGTSWEVFVIIGSSAYSGIMGCIKIANELIKLRKEWYQSEYIRLGVEIQKEKLKSDKTENALLKEHIKSLFEKKKGLFIKDLFVNLGSDINSETTNSISIGINKIIELLENGIEIHPSLNPPEYIEDVTPNNFNINYATLKEILHKEDDVEDVKEIENKVLERAENDTE